MSSLLLAGGVSGFWVESGAGLEGASTKDGEWLGS